MDMKSFITGLVLGLIVGILIGMTLLCGQSEQPPKDRGFTMKPSEVAANNGRQPGQWPFVDCGGRQAAEILDDIWTQGQSGLMASPPEMDAGQAQMLESRLWGIALDNVPAAQAQAKCEWIKQHAEAASSNSNSGEWQATIDHLGGME